jgi:integrase
MNDENKALEQNPVLKPTVAIWVEEYKAQNFPRFAQNTRTLVNTELVRFALFLGRRAISGNILHEYMAEQRRRVAGESLIRAMRWTGAFLKWAEEMGYLDRRYSSLSIFKCSAVLVIHKPPQRFTPEQYEAMKEATKGTGWHYATIMAYRTGARLSDACLLKWESVNLEELYIHYLPWKTRKSQRYATCPFQAGGDFHNVLIELNASRDKRPHWDQFVCPELAMRYATQSDVFQSYELSRQFGGYCKKIGAAHLSFHKLRNTFMAKCVDGSIPFAQARQITGLGSDSVFMRYAKPNLDVLRVAIDKIDSQDLPKGTSIIQLPQNSAA